MARIARYPSPDAPVSLPPIEPVPPLPPIPPFLLDQTLQLNRDLQRNFEDYKKLGSELRDTILDFDQKSLQLLQCDSVLLQTVREIETVAALKARFPEWVFRAKIVEPVLKDLATTYGIELLPH